MRRLLVLCVAGLVSLAAWAHGDEDHGEAAAPAPVADIAPRAAAQSEEFELVAILAHGKLTLYLDRYTDNAPVADATIDVESGAFRAVATQRAPGVYEVPGAAFAQAGRFPLTLAVQTSDSADLLSATLEHAGPATAPEHVHDRSDWAIWLVAAAGVVAGATLLRMRYRRQPRL